jgi:hypothetical protein
MVYFFWPCLAIVHTDRMYVLSTMSAAISNVYQLNFLNRRGENEPDTLGNGGGGGNNLS